MDSLPRVYTPRNIRRPDWCPQIGPWNSAPGAQGPDGGEGSYWVAPPRPTAAWRRSAKGWWVDIDGHRPQHLVRTEPHPRITRTIPVRGINPDHLWLVPQLLRPVGRDPQNDCLYEPAIDRVWRGGDWAADNLDGVIRPLLALASKSPESQDRAALGLQLPLLAIDILAITHHVDADLIDLLGWLSEGLMGRIILAASGLPVEDACSP